MIDVTIGEGHLVGKGVYANRDFKKGEIKRATAALDYCKMPCYS